ncbi:MAG: lipid-A-disaccharide synthase [Planctomycetota bacterium]|nr:MAG: lipid-A-disaccharide synthase [Planctomycetota bacterium]
MPKTKLIICILAGETSGDKHASKLVQSLKSRLGNLEFYGLGGPELIRENVRIITHISKLAMIGLSGATKVFPEAYRTYKKLKKEFTENKPDLIIPVDYGGFNLRVCKLAHKFNIPVYYYIPPKIWAWNQKRVHKLRRFTKKVFVINQFELDFYQHHGIDAIYVGNPSAQEIKNYKFESDFKLKNGLNPNDPLITIFPGSRKKEVSFMFSIFLKAAIIIAKEKPNMQFMVARPEQISEEFLNSFCKTLPFKIIFKENDSFNLMKNSDFLILKSGTTTLEAGIIGTPMVVSYIVDSLSYFLGKILIKAKYMSLVNLYLNKPSVKELLQKEVTPDNISREALKTLNDPEYLADKNNDLSVLTQLLGDDIPSEKVADIIIKELKATTVN